MRIATAALCLLLFALMVASAYGEPREVSEVATAGEPAVRQYPFLNGRTPKGNLCGVRSVYIVLRAFGIEKSYDAVLSAMPPGLYGNSMTQIVQYLKENTSLSIAPGSFRAAQLHTELAAAANRRAIINVSDHWVVVRETTDNAFEIIDFPKKYYLPVEALDGLWDGYAVIIAGPAPLISTSQLLTALILTSVGVCAAFLLVRRCRAGRSEPAAR